MTVRVICIVINVNYIVFFCKFCAVDIFKVINFIYIYFLVFVWFSNVVINVYFIEFFGEIRFVGIYV